MSRERVEVADQQIERRDPELGELVAVRLQPQVGQQSGVHVRVQGLDPPVQALREPGHLLDRGHRQAGVGEGPGGRPGGDDLDPGVDQGLRRARPARSCRTPSTSAPPDRPARLRRSCPCPPFGRSTCHVPGGQPVGDVHQQLALGDLDPLVQDRPRCRRRPPAPPPGPGSPRCRRRRRPGTRVAPVTLTPYASASRGPCMPGKDGSSAGWVLIIRPPNAARKRRPDQLHEAGADHQVRRVRRRPPSVSAASQSAPAGVVGHGLDEGGDARRRRPVQPGDRRGGRRRPRRPATPYAGVGAASIRACSRVPVPEIRTTARAASPREVDGQRHGDHLISSGDDPLEPPRRADDARRAPYGCYRTDASSGSAGDQRRRTVPAPGR